MTGPEPRTPPILPPFADPCRIMHGTNPGPPAFGRRNAAPAGEEERTVAEASDRTGGKRPRILAGLLLIAAIATVGTAAPGATATLAQDARGGVDGNRYTSPTYGYTVSWDETVWTVGADRSDDGVDYLELGAEASTLALAGTDAYTTLDDCIRGEIAELEEIESTSGIERDRDLVDSIEAGENARVVVVTYTVTPLEDLVFENVKSIECRPLVAGEAVLAITQVVAQEDFADETERRNEVVAELELDDAPVPATGEAEATEKADTEPTKSAEDDATAEVDPEPTEDAEDEPTEDADAGPVIDINPGDDTPTADLDDEPTETAGSPLPGRSGVDGNRYVGPNWGYGITWDDEIWEVEEEDAQEDYDYLQLGTPRGTLYLEAYPDYGGDAEVCLASAIDEIEETEGVSDLTVAENDDGDPIRDVGEDLAYAVYTFAFESRGSGTIEFGNLIECRTLIPGEVVLEISYLTQVDVFNDEIEDVQDVLETIEPPESETDEDAAEDADETPAADEDDGSTEERDPEPTAESSNDDGEDGDGEATAEPTEEG